MKGGNIVRTPGLSFPDGFHIQLFPKNWSFFYLGGLVFATKHKNVCAKMSLGFYPTSIIGDREHNLKDGVVITHLVNLSGCVDPSTLSCGFDQTW